MIYLLFFLTILLVNLLPAFAPPTWTLIVFFLNYYQLNTYLTILLAVIAATLGRYVLYSYSEWLSKIVFNRWGRENLQFLGQSLGHTPKRNFIFVFLYSITPLSTTALFVAGGLAKINKNILLLAFALGRIISYTVLALTSQVVVTNLSEVYNGSPSWEQVLSASFALMVLLLFIFLDWKKLVQNGKIRLNLKVWKWNKNSK